MKRLHKIIISLAIAILIVGSAYYYVIQISLPHFHTVREGVLYRSGQPRGIGLELVRLMGIRTLINLRRPDSDGTAEEKAFAAEKGLNFYNFSIGSNHDAIEDAVRQFLAVVDDKSQWPILVHCSRGKERSGVLSAIFRIENERWSNEMALEETYRLGLERGAMPIPEDFIKNYRARWAGGEDRAQQSARNLPEVPWQE
jgi:protein tyrosine/serine phosphatase